MCFYNYFDLDINFLKWHFDILIIFNKIYTYLYFIIRDEVNRDPATVRSYILAIFLILFVALHKVTLLNLICPCYWVSEYLTELGWDACHILGAPVFSLTALLWHGFDPSLDDLTHTGAAIVLFQLLCVQLLGLCPTAQEPQLLSLHLFVYFGCAESSLLLGLFSGCGEGATN